MLIGTLVSGTNLRFSKNKVLFPLNAALPFTWVRAEGGEARLNTNFFPGLKFPYRMNLVVRVLETPMRVTYRST